MGGDTQEKANVGFEANQLELIAVITIMVTLLFHFISVKLEQVLKRHKHLSEMLHHLYRELMVLGLISFGLFALEKQKGSSFSHDTKEIFENIHILIFLVAFGYTIFTVILMGLSVRISKFWDGVERQDHDYYSRLKRQFEEIREKFKNMGIITKIFSVCLLFKHFNLVEQVSFHDLRLHFMHSNHLPPSFSFARYLRKCKSHVLLQFGDIHPACWMTLIIILICDMLLRNAIAIPEMYMIRIWQLVLVALGILLCIVPIAVLVKTRAILSEIMLHPEMIDFDPVAARYYIDHWRDAEDAAPEQSLSYAFAEDSVQRVNVHFTAESAARRVARTFQIDHWGQKSANEANGHPFSTLDHLDHEQDTDGVLGPNEQPRLGRVQSVRNVMFHQLNLFWFNSHIFMLRLMQVCQFLAVWYFAILFQFHKQLIGDHHYVYPLAAVPVIVLLTCFAWTLPIYTIIIHVGQLVDLDIVLEARIKASRPAQDLTAVVVAPAQLRRTSTLMLLPKRERFRLQLSVLVFGGRFQMALFWCILIQTSWVLFYYFPTLDIYSWIPYTTPIIPSLFLLEMAAKLYASGYKFFKKSYIALFDLFIVLATFILAILQLCITTVTPPATAVVLLRVFQIIRASRYGRIMRQNQESIYEAKIGKNEIEMQMQRTLENMASEPSQQRRGISTLSTSDGVLLQSDVLLRRARTLPATSSPLGASVRNFKFSSGNEKFEIPVQSMIMRPEL